MFLRLSWLCLALAGPAADATSAALPPATSASTVPVAPAPPLDPASHDLSVRVDPPAAVLAGARVSLQKVAPGAPPTACPLDGDGTCQARVEPGEWEVAVEAPGYQRHVERLTIGAQPSTRVGLALVPVPTAVAAPTEPAAPAVEGPAPAPERVPRRTRIRLSAGLLLPGVPIFMAGLAVAIHGANVYARVDETKQVNADLLPAVRLRAAGLGMMGAAVGLFATGLTAEYDVKPWLWLTELGVGAATLIGGSAWMAVSTLRWNSNQLHQMVCTNNEGVDCFTAHRLAAGFVLGLGSGLVFGATTGLIVRAAHRKPPRVGLAPAFGAGHGGLSLHGRF